MAFIHDINMLVFHLELAHEALKDSKEDVDRLVKERDEYKELADRWRADWHEVKDQCDALAAHVENSRADKLTAARNIRENAAGDALLIGVADMLERSAGESPTTSLARLLAEKQAEALEAMASRFWPVGLIGKGCERDALLLRASELRRQAEGGE